MEKQIIKIKNIPAIIYGTRSDKICIYVHGRYSKKEEAESFADLVDKSGYQVISFDLPEHGERKNEQYKCTVQNAVADLITVYSGIKTNYNHFSLYACSVGAYFSLMAYQNITFDKTLFLSPILDMERLIQNMMKWADVSEDQLEERQLIDTTFGEQLSWDYYQYVKKYPISKWNSEIFILYGENDNLTERSVLNAFADKFKCDVDIMKDGEHYFHTAEQLSYLDNWIKRTEIR